MILIHELRRCYFYLYIHSPKMMGEWDYDGIMFKFCSIKKLSCQFGVRLPYHIKSNPQRQDKVAIVKTSP